MKNTSEEIVDRLQQIQRARDEMLSKPGTFHVWNNVGSDMKIVIGQPRKK